VNQADLPRVGIVMGSNSDWPTMKLAAEMLDRFGVPYEAKVTSAHRTPELMFEYAATAEERGLEVVIAGAGGAAHLPGMVASKTVLPVLGGSGDSGTWSREGQVSRGTGMVQVLCVIKPERLDGLLDAAFAVVERHIGIVTVSDCEVLRAERF